MEIIVNPGTGPVAEASESHAIENMKHYITDLGVSCNYIRIPEKDYGEGRFAFLVWLGNECHEIQMPGLPLENVRYMDNPNQNPFDFPRLYVDDSSWLWMFAIRHLFESDEES